MLSWGTLGIGLGVEEREMVGLYVANLMGSSLWTSSSVM